MASTRLPGKVLADIAGQPMLARVVVRVRRSKLIDRLVVATSIDSKDDPIVELCEQLECEYSRGSALDVLDRCFQATREFVGLACFLFYRANNILLVNAGLEGF